jgi:hypothetical protein
MPIVFDFSEENLTKLFEGFLCGIRDYLLCGPLSSAPTVVV